MSRVRIYQCTTYKKQNVLNPKDEPLELHTWENLMFVSTKCSAIEIYNINSLQLVARFCTISRAETIMYSDYGNCIVTLERDSDIVHCFVRLYMGFPCHLANLATDNRMRESFLMLDPESGVSDGINTYLTSGMTKQDLNERNGKAWANESRENWDVERIELPSQGAVNCVGMCSHTGFMAVAWETAITLYILTQDTVPPQHEKPREEGKSIRCGVTILMEIELGFVVTKIVLEDIYLACLSDFEVQVFKLSLMPDRYTSIPKEKKLDTESILTLGVETIIKDENDPEIRQSEDFIQLKSFYSYPTLHLEDRNTGEIQFDPSILNPRPVLGEESSMEQGALSSIENHCIVFPSVSNEKMPASNKDDQNKKMMEIWGPRRLIGNRTLKVTTPDGHKLTNSAISTMLYLKLPYTVGKSNEYSLSTTNDQTDKSIDIFHTIKMVPEYINEGDKKYLVGICLLVASKKEGHFYDILDFSRKIVTFPFTKDLIDIAMSPGLMHVVYLSRIEVYITRSYAVASENARNLVKQGKVYDIDIPSSVSTPVNTTPNRNLFGLNGPNEESDQPTPLYWLHQVSPPTQDMEISQIGQSSFVNLTSCTNTNNRLVILSKLKPEARSIGHFGKLVRRNSPKIEEIIWSIYILDIVSLESIAKQMEMMAQPYIHENPPIYFQLICDAHFLRKSALSGASNAGEENEFECANVESIDSVVISLNPTQMRLDDDSYTMTTGTLSKRQLIGLQKSCLLIADFLRQENGQLALDYYKQGSHGVNQFLHNSILHLISPVSEDTPPDSVCSSIQPSTLVNMANSMCFNQSDANSLARSIIQMERQPEFNPQTDDSIVFKVFNLCMHLDNNDEIKAKESVCELYLHSKEFLAWANDHLNTFVAQELEGSPSLLAMFLLIETPTIMISLFPKMCLMGLVDAGNIIELIKHNTEDIDRDEMVINFIIDLIRLQATVENRIADLELAITELVITCLKLFESQIEFDTRQFDNVCAEYRPSWLDSLPPFGEYNRAQGIKGTAFIFIVQNIMCSPFNSAELSEKILELTASSEYYEGVRAVIYLKLSRFKDLVIIFLNEYQSVFPKLCESLKVKSEKCELIQCIVNEILTNTEEDDMLSREFRERICYFIVSLTRYMSYDEIMEVLPEQSPPDLYKRCFDFHLHIEKSNLIVQGLCESNL